MLLRFCLFGMSLVYPYPLLVIWLYIIFLVTSKVQKFSSIASLFSSYQCCCWEVQCHSSSWLLLRSCFPWKILVSSLCPQFPSILVKCLSCIIFHWLCWLLCEFCQPRNSFPLVLEHLLYSLTVFPVFTVLSFYNSFIRIIHLRMVH